jgi:signal transduction histidine kinase
VKKVEFPSPGTSSDRTVAERELVRSLGWLIRLRWFAAAAVLAVTPVSMVATRIPPQPLLAVGLALLAYNALFHAGLQRLDRSPSRSLSAYRWFAWTQVSLDWASVAILIHFSGGIDSPAVLFFLFHIAIAFLLFPHERGFVYVGLAPLLVGGVAFLEYRGIIRHVPLLEPTRHQNVPYILLTVFFFTCAAYVMAYLSISISRRLRRRENEIAGLYRSLRASTSTLDLQEVLDRLTEATAQVLGCKGASIRLLDNTERQLEVATIHGLSEDYRERGPIELHSAVIDREAMSARTTVLIPDAPNDSRTRYPEKVRAEGIKAMLSAPLMGKHGPIGVLRAYGGVTHSFTREDASFLLAIAAHGAVTIENAKAHRMLEELDQHKSEFVRMVTHELRSPIQVSQNLLTVLSRGYKGELNGGQRDLVERALRRIQFLQTLVDDLLDLAAGKVRVMAPSEAGPVSLCNVLVEVANRFEAESQDRGVQLHVLCRSEPLIVWSDRDALDRIVNNLVGNAIKYTPKGEVRVTLEKAGDAARLVVADTGIGIPSGELPQIWNEFFRAGNAKALEDRGTGLGLAIVRDLVERHGGKIDVSSEEGRGSVFTVLLPLARDAVQA